MSNAIDKDEFSMIVSELEGRGFEISEQYAPTKVPLCGWSDSYIRTRKEEHGTGVVKGVTYGMTRDITRSEGPYHTLKDHPNTFPVTHVTLDTDGGEMEKTFFGSLPINIGNTIRYSHGVESDRFYLDKETSIEDIIQGYDEMLKTDYGFKAEVLSRDGDVMFSYGV